MTLVEKQHEKIEQLETQKEQLVQQKEELVIENDALKQKADELELKLKWYEQRYRVNQAKKFGQSSEKTDPNQLSFFTEAEKEVSPKEPEPTIETIQYQRKKPKRTQKELLENLPVECIDYTLSEEEQYCPQCNYPLHVIGTYSRKELVIIPAQAKVIEYRQHRYACRHCEQQAIQTPIIEAPMPKAILPGSIASPSLLADILYQKYVNHIPLYRQESQFKQLDVALSRQTLSNWVIRTADRLAPFAQRLHEHLIQCDCLHSDETTVQVIKEDGREAKNKSYMWLYRSGKYHHPIVWYDYQPTRSSAHPKRVLKDFHGYLHCDGYSGYNQLDVTRIGCLAHIRRKFKEAIIATKEKGKSNKATVAEIGLTYCNRLYAVERKLKDAEPDQRYDERLEKLQPIFNEFYAWLNDPGAIVLPKSKEGKAIAYAKDFLPLTQNILKDGRLEIDNNRAERSIKPFVLGRKNWLFNYSVKGAKASSTIYSLIETAKENNVKVHSYLTYILTQIPTLNLDDNKAIDALLPWSDTLPEMCRYPKQLSD